MPRSLRRWFPLAVAALAAIGAVAWWMQRPAPALIADAEVVSRRPRITPDYVGIVVPPNIAPLDFAIREDGRRFLVKIRGESGETIEVDSRSAAIEIPPRGWRSLLEANRGRELRWEVYVQAGRRWQCFQPIVNRVAEHDIDEHLVYRLVGPVYNKWSEVAIRQRNLATYEDSGILDGESLGRVCVNCHSFAANDANRMLVGLRGGASGAAALLVEDAHATKLGTAFGYTAWHPSGQIAAYSTNKVRQFFHAAGPQVRDVVDLASALAYFRVDARITKRIPGASDEQHLTTYPAWSPDGRTLYYCRAPVLWTDQETVPPQRFAEVKYDLVRIAYDIESDRWGSPETVLSAKQTGLSILLPRVSPDGKFLLFCMCRYGCFPAFHPTSDLYLMDLAKGTYEKCPVNSEFSESWHSWSSNSRWIAFSSKRAGGTFTRCYLSYFDPAGRMHKPFIVPQQDPEAYDSLLKTISVPELLTSAVTVRPATLARAARRGQAIAVDATDADPDENHSDPYSPTTP